MLHAIYEAGPMQFRVSVMGEEGQEGLRAFWNNSRGDPWEAAFPELRQHPDPSSAFAALMVHYDGTEVAMHKQARNCVL
eukprot:2289382-Alexandrium_andersonii.AAC.1